MPLANKNHTSKHSQLKALSSMPQALDLATVILMANEIKIHHKLLGIGHIE